MAAASIGNLRVDIATRETMIGMALQVVAICQVAIRAQSESRIDWVSLSLSETSNSYVRIFGRVTSAH